MTADPAPAGNPAPVGFFDSGIGGLGVMLAVRERLPYQPLLYYADTGHFPYGPRSRDEVIGLASQAARELLRRGAGVIVVACNTASTAALPALRAAFSVPFVGIVPAVKPAGAVSRAGRVAVLATAGTVQADALRDLVERFAAGIEVLALPAPGLADRVERGDLAGAETAVLLERYLAPARARGVDVVVLGCTHYVFLRPLVERIMGPGVAVLDTGEAVARQVERVLFARGGGLMRQPDTDAACQRAVNVPTGGPGPVEYITSGDVAAFVYQLDGLRAAGVPLPPGPVHAAEECP